MEKLDYQRPWAPSDEPETLEQLDYNRGCFPAVSGMLLAVASCVFAFLTLPGEQGWTKELLAGMFGIFSCVGGWVLAIQTIRRRHGAVRGSVVVVVLLPGSFVFIGWITHLLMR